MLNSKSTFIQNANNRKGQVALFVALIFQMLFLFFAMVINIGLLVHHKINLQNSVDLAAYYGAMRQAENMNAIGHINYQVRQSWKLLSWRYRMLGSAGEWSHHPFNKQTKKIDASRGGDEDILSTDPITRDLQEAPAFCITYIPFKPMPPGENTCRNMATMSGIKLFNIPPIIAPFQSFSQVIRNTTQIMQNAALERCRYFGAYNYVMLAKFMVAYNIDQGSRMDMIAALSRATSLSTDDFYDIDGQKASTGITNTLRNNLTAANRASLGEDGVKIYNSLGADGCNATGAAPGQAAKWLTPVRIYPGFSYIDTECGSGANPELGITSKELTGTSATYPHHINEVNELKDVIVELSKYVGYRSDLNDNYNFSVGVEKNPWCMAYVGVSAETAPKIPFSPIGSVTLKARAFYKPFGGRIGPWYKNTWSSGSTFSNGGTKTDELLPPRVTDLAQLASMNTPENKATRAANHSRFVGDKLGLKSLRMLANYGQAIYQLDQQWMSDSRTGTVGFDEAMYSGDDAPNFAHWDELPFDFAKDSGDLLSWNVSQNLPSKMRRLELTAILPDAFDLAYYSIEPDFYHNYFTRIRDGYLKGPGRDFNKMFRPDLGYRKGFKAGSVNYDEYNIKKQYEVLKDSELNLPVNERFTFLSLKWENLLTSWAPKNLMDYSLDTQKFGKCLAPPLGDENNKPNPPTSGNCVVGGSSGYSVKMVSSSYLRATDLKLGGEGVAGAGILNPPPDDADF